MGHIANVRKQIGARHSRSQIGGIAQGGKLVAKVGPRDHCTRHHTDRDIQCPPNADERNPHRGRSGPRAACGQRYNRTDHNASRQENSGMQDLQPVVNHGRNNATEQPRSRQCPNKQQNQDGACGRAQVMANGLKHGCVGHSIAKTHHSRYRCPQKQDKLIGAAQRVVAIDKNIERQERHQKKDRYKRLTKRRSGRRGCRHWFSFRV